MNRAIAQFRKLTVLGAGIVALALFAASSRAGDGRLEINQACVASGCFAGDTAGLPVEITSAGSYVLTSNLSHPGANFTGIRIMADRVTLDLNGFEIAGPGALEAGTGVSVEATRAEIRNGFISGINLGITNSGGGTNGDHSRAVGVTVSDVANEGIRLGAYSVVRDCNISALLNGITLNGHSLAEDNLLTMTGELIVSQGISMGSIGIVKNNIVRDAPGAGISAGGNSIISGNVVRSSGLSGISTSGDGSVIEGNTSVFNQEYGIELAGSDHLVRGNNAFDNNQSGGSFTNIEACASCTFIDNHAP